jgi:hypothetical protein
VENDSKMEKGKDDKRCKRIRIMGVIVKKNVKKWNKEAGRNKTAWKGKQKKTINIQIGKA